MALRKEKFGARSFFNCSTLLSKAEPHADSSYSIAGSDTSALAMRATLLYMITDSRVQSKLLEKIRNASISTPITDVEARKLPYLQAVIKEELRIFPPVTGIMFKEVSVGGDTVNGFFLPEGTQVGWSSFGLMRNVKVWGDDAKLFRPERWFEGSPEEIKKEIDVEMVFGYRKYQCLGKSVAYLELNKVFVEVCDFHHLAD
jgi:cytochrome P450